MIFHQTEPAYCVNEVKQLSDGRPHGNRMVFQTPVLMPENTPTPIGRLIFICGCRHLPAFNLIPFSAFRKDDGVLRRLPANGKPNRAAIQCSFDELSDCRRTKSHHISVYENCWRQGLHEKGRRAGTNVGGGLAFNRCYPARSLLRGVLAISRLWRSTILITNCLLSSDPQINQQGQKAFAVAGSATTVVMSGDITGSAIVVEE